MKEFTEALRYDYPLTKDSLVIDAGGYEGNWAAEIYRKYACNIMVFEPVMKFHEKLVSRFDYAREKITLSCAGLGGKECGGGKDVTLRIQNDSTGVFAGSSDMEVVKLFGAAYVIGGLADMMILKVAAVDLLKLNIEGMEYDVLEDLLDEDRPGGPRINRVTNLQVQFHTCVPDHAARRDAIRERLAKTHHLTYDAPFVWENWEKNS